MEGLYLAVRSGTLRGDTASSFELFRGEWVVSYLNLFREEQREAVWGCLGDRPTLEQVVAKMGGFSAVLELDECVGLRFAGDDFFVTEQRGFSEDDYVPFLFYKRYSAMEFEAGRLKAGRVSVQDYEYPDGYCYLSGFPVERRLNAASVFGRGPVAGRLVGYLPDLEVGVLGNGAHAPVVHGAVLHTVEELARAAPQLAIGGHERCGFLQGDPAYSGRGCSNCARPNFKHESARVMSLPCHGAGVTFGGKVERADVFSTAYRQPMDILMVTDEYGMAHHGHGGLTTKCSVDACGHERSPNVRDVVSHIGVHECHAQHRFVSIQADFWCVELLPGEVLRGRHTRFAPVASAGGLMLGIGHARLVYQGKRKALSIRLFTQHSYAKFQHVRLGYGLGGTLGKLARQGGVTTFFVSSGYATRALPPESCSPTLRDMTYGLSGVIQDEREDVYPVGPWGSIVKLDYGCLRVDRGVLWVTPAEAYLGDDGFYVYTNDQRVMVVNHSQQPRRFAASIMPDVASEKISAVVYVPEDLERIDAYSSDEERSDLEDLVEKSALEPERCDSAVAMYEDTLSPLAESKVRRHRRRGSRSSRRTSSVVSDSGATLH